ncbi:MAG: GNAT family N-acetyltransferase [Solirubrobacteraceae bacterium]|nr:GNAT family N-acetyltransferase [Solirubrobacteraceae bacterium]
MTDAELRTERLLLRAPEQRDLEAFVLMCADPEVMRHIALGRPYDRARGELAFHTMCDRWMKEGAGLFTAETLEDGEYLGFVGTATISERSIAGGETEIGWRLRRAAWGRGLATEGARAVYAHAAGPLVALIQPANTASRRVAEKLGMTETEAGKGPLGEPVVVYR